MLRYSKLTLSALTLLLFSCSGSDYIGISLDYDWLKYGTQETTPSTVSSSELRVVLSSLTYETKHDMGIFVEHDNLIDGEMNCLENLREEIYDAFLKLPARIECEECDSTDVEWIEIRRNAFVDRVTFPKGHSIPEIQPLLDRFREIQSRFEPAVHGRWKWQRTHGGIAQVDETPASRGFDLWLFLRPDGSCKLYRNNSVIAQSSWVLDDDRLVFTEELPYFGAQASFSLVGERLVLEEASTADGLIHELAPAHSLCENP